MKLLYTFATVLSFLAVVYQPFVHAANDTAVFYDDGRVDITDHAFCIPLNDIENGNVASIAFGVNVECKTYGSKDCSGSPFNQTPLSFTAGIDATPNDLGQAFPNGSVKCT